MALFAIGAEFALMWILMACAASRGDRSVSNEICRRRRCFESLDLVAAAALHRPVGAQQPIVASVMRELGWLERGNSMTLCAILFELAFVVIGVTGGTFRFHRFVANGFAGSGGEYAAFFAMAILARNRNMFSKQRIMSLRMVELEAAGGVAPFAIAAQLSQMHVGVAGEAGRFQRLVSHRSCLRIRLMTLVAGCFSVN